ncbi:hypothetical protein DIE14_34705 [Burkholderia sp. Bp9017]|uniref:hypothetical protein n=1 Tax=Burkholderia TaxID=32008 RepID=UPI000F5D5F23|nr:MULTISPECIES: hypothetical protein [Burkholderia]MBY4871000.1 hypothetical protein [Burkholderia anthina]RQZ13922.1 hypothetical protein DIE14_34705 [Burkholderia sp. Bp9017]
MNTLIVVCYSDLDTARRVAVELETLCGRGVVSPTGIVIVECAADGQLRTQTVGCGEAASGSLVGRALERVEAALDASRERPVDDALIDRIARGARPDTVSLGLAAAQLDILALSAALAPFGGDVTDTTLSIDDELKLVEAISKRRDGGVPAAD